MQEQLVLRSPCNLTGRFSSLGLSSVNRSRPTVSGYLDSPTLVARHNMNVALRHDGAIPAGDRAQTSRMFASSGALNGAPE